MPFCLNDICHLRHNVASDTSPVSHSPLLISSFAAFLIDRALKFIAENAVKGIGPQDVAAHLGVSRTLLDLRFREMATGTVGELIMEKRLAALSAMLRKSKLPICKLAEECGFGNAKYAKAVFKKYFGMTMREYRRQNHS